IIEKLKSGAPEITFSTDVIVGFPTETEEDFIKTRQIMQDVGFDNAYIFKYSPRKGTKAAEYKDDVPQDIKEERNQILLADLAERAAKHNSILVGKKLEVLVEGESKRNSSRWSGRTDTNKLVVFEKNKDIRPGDLLTIKITETTASTLYGYII
ncbi:MAG: TRAM domain-containing protein, partial [Candidatus Nanoarchaeia archaeon]